MDAVSILILVLQFLAVALLIALIFRRDPRVEGVLRLLESIETSVTRTQDLVRDEIARNREESATAQRHAREELAAALGKSGEVQRAEVEKLTSTTEQKLEAVRASVADSSNALRNELRETLVAFNRTVMEGMKGLSEAQQRQLDSFSTRIDSLTKTVEEKLEAMKNSVEDRLTQMRNDNERQLERMRETVDEKLHDTLEKRLGESFRQVSERLEEVHKGLGEMQTLASGVGDLKKVLTNVKARGTWGEVQLGALLEQVLTPEQYAANVAMKGGERVEFAVKLPGKGDRKDEVVWLPIDSKFPLEDYQRLLEAQERADIAAVEASGKQLENRLRSCAKDIAEKYIDPPFTTDFAILFLPTEGLFAEVLRRPGLADSLQRLYRVSIAGPTTLLALLNSLQMGFRTLAIEKRSSEVWSLLGAVKTEWRKYGEALEKVQRKLHEATDGIDTVRKRTRVIDRKLRDVQELPAEAAAALLPQDEPTNDSEDIARENA
ncbi:MAG: DNA recombination protein RmuC [Bacteroidota bacterium]|nr:DNA recombination protein RmuC [Bacteroidota bacterium]